MLKRTREAIGMFVIYVVHLNYKNMEGVETLEKGINTITKNPERKEGKVARFIESQTAKLPSDLFLWAAVSSMVASLTLKVLKLNHTSLFVGQWAPSFLLFGIYNKIVKVGGHD